jgi:hypothetical protein
MKLQDNSEHLALSGIRYHKIPIPGGGSPMLSPVFTPFIKNSPISVMARGMLERVLNPEQLDEWFDATAEEQYTKELLFSTLF